jgi:hypothetical protein
MLAVCSARPRAQTHSNSKFGNQWWLREVYHLEGANKRTLCGRDSSDYLTVGEMDDLDDNCCVRCRAKT